MILQDENNLYIKKGIIEKINKEIGLGATGMYLTLLSLNYSNDSKGISEKELFSYSANSNETSKEKLIILLNHKYVEKDKDNLLMPKSVSF